MKTSLITLLLIAATTVSTPAAAQTADLKRLRDAATGPTIAAGRASFRLIPGAVLRTLEPAGAAASTQLLSTTQSSAQAPLARIDRYAVYLDDPTSARSLAVARAGAQQPTVAAAIETRSGQLILLGASIKLFETTPAVARALATRTGGKLIYASAIDGSAMISYDVVSTALDWCKQLQGTSGVGSILPEVIPRAMRSR